MFLFKHISPLQNYLTHRRNPGATVGFVPTMGALHEGHLSLIQHSIRENDVTVCSIFVNPTQFNDPKDLEQYPRTTSKDMELLLKVGNEVLFLPAVDTIYPAGLHQDIPFDFGALETVMEGAFRPGHFQGVAVVVRRLLEIVAPDRLYMGQKDYQQTAIIQEMINTLGLPVSLIRCPIIRESDGLAMSSRNQRLSPDFRKKAVVLYETLQMARRRMKESSPTIISQEALAAIRQAGLRPEYFEIADSRSLQRLSDFSQAEEIVACVAAWAGEVRLIDNSILRAKQQR